MLHPGTEGEEDAEGLQGAQMVTGGIHHHPSR